MAKKARRPWFQVLEAVRRLAGPKGVKLFTSDGVAQEAGIRDGKKREARHIASAWLGKFLRWGYIAHSGRAVAGPSRRAYRITDWGLRYEPQRDGQVMTKAEERGYVKGVEQAARTVNQILCDEKEKGASAPEHRMKEIHSCRAAALTQVHALILALIESD